MTHEWPASPIQPSLFVMTVMEGRTKKALALVTIIRGLRKSVDGRGDVLKRDTSGVQVSRGINEAGGPGNTVETVETGSICKLALIFPVNTQ